jgi:hypothetical protein
LDQNVVAATRVVSSASSTDIVAAMAKGQPERDESKPVRVWTLAIWIPLAIVGGLVAFSAAYILVTVLTVGWEQLLASANVEGRSRLAILVLGVIAASVTLVFALRRQIVSERRLRIDHRDLAHREQSEQSRAAEAGRAESQRRDEFVQTREIERKHELRGRYVVCAEQLASESEAVRLAGAYGMAQLASDWDDSNARQSCIDVLCAYLRIENRFTVGDSEWLREEEVRSSIVRILAAGLRPGAGNEWSLVDIDLKGARLQHVDFRDAVFPGTADFSGTSFVGTASFELASFAGKANFNGAVFDGRVSFAGVHLSGGVSFDEAEFRARAYFQGMMAQRFFARRARFGDRAVFDSARFEGLAKGLDSPRKSASSAPSSATMRRSRPGGSRAISTFIWPVPAEGCRWLKSWLPHE